jgi:hypothetical protein
MRGGGKSIVMQTDVRAGLPDDNNNKYESYFPEEQWVHWFEEAL